MNVVNCAIKTWERHRKCKRSRPRKQWLQGIQVHEELGKTTQKE